MRLTGLACNSPARVAAIGSLTNKPGQAGEMSGYPYSATGLPANFQIGVAAAADSSLLNAKAAWIIFQSRSVKPTAPNAYNNYPNFAVWQRSLPPSVPPSVPPRPVEGMPLQRTPQGGFAAKRSDSPTAWMLPGPSPPA